MQLEWTKSNLIVVLSDKHKWYTKISETPNITTYLQTGKSVKYIREEYAYVKNYLIM